MLRGECLASHYGLQKWAPNEPEILVPRLLIDLSDSLIAEELTALIHQAAYLHLLDLQALRQAIERANGHHQLDVLEQAIEAWLDGSAGTRSRGEVAFRRALIALGLPRPLTNRKVIGIEVDFHWPGRKLIVEIDGPNHLRPPTRSTDRSRDDELIAAGWTVLRARTYERAIERLAQAVQMPAGGPDSARDGSSRARRVTDGPPCKAA